MRPSVTRFVFRTVASSLAVAGAAALRGTIEGRSAWRPLNTISHIVWGSHVGRHGFSVREAGLALLLNGAACAFTVMNNVGYGALAPYAHLVSHHA